MPPPARTFPQPETTVPAKPLPNPAHHSSAESASRALRAALAERLMGRLMAQGDVGGTVRRALEVITALPEVAPQKLHRAA